MSMTIYLVKLPPPLAGRVVADPGLLDEVLGHTDVADPDVASLDSDQDELLEDYLQFGFVHDEPGRFPWLERALNGMGEKIDYEYGYGPGFVVTPQQAAEIATGMAEEGWWTPGHEVVTTDQGIAEFYATAARQGRTVIGGIG